MRINASTMNTFVFAMMAFLASRSTFAIPCSYFSPNFDFRISTPKNINEIDPSVEPWPQAFCELEGQCRYYGDTLSDYDLSCYRFNPSEMDLGKGNGNVGTARSFDEYLKRLGLSNNDIIQARGEKWLSVGEGSSDFTFRSHQS